MIEFRQAPIDQSKLAFLVVDHDIVRFYISMHDPSWMTEVERFEEFENVVADVIVCEFWIEDFEIGARLRKAK